MASSLISGLSGLRSHQSWIDVIGNNLANSSTPGFKGSRTLFSELFSRTLRPATAPTGTNGGTNPSQVGLGSSIGHVDRDMGQGPLNLTGRTFDLALQGNGFFAVNDGVQNLFTRVGTFGLDSNNNMVDLRTGYNVLNSSGSPFQIDLDAVVPPSASTSVDFAGNLPAEVTGPLAEILTTSSAFAEGTAAQLDGSAGEPFVIPSGQTWTMELVVNGGAPQSVSVTSTTGSVTADDVVTAINQLDHITAVNNAGAIQLTSDRVGTGSTIKVNPGPGATNLAGVLGLNSSLVSGTETPAGLTTDLNDLTANLSDYQLNDFIDVSGTDFDGTPVQASFEYGVDGTTLGDFVSFIDSQFSGATAAFNAATGQISLSASQTGESELSIAILDSNSLGGSTDWAQHSMGVTTEGAGPDTSTTSIEVFDAAGSGHLLTFTYERQTDGTWNMTTSLPPGEGTIVNGDVTGITFNANGSLATPSSGSVDIQFTGQAVQSISVDFGTPGQFSGATQFGASANILATGQDGYGAGELSSIQVASDGEIQGFYTNGELQSLGNFGVATFVNEKGLNEFGDSYWQATANSGTQIIGSGISGGAGEISGGALEQSNVDTAEEFVNMIQAQRGFQANARVISITDELLQEVVNLV